MQEGEIGLLQAAARFEPERDIRFSTYATWWIRAAMQDFVLRNWSIVRTGTTAAQKSLFFNLRRLRQKLETVDGKLTAGGHQQIATLLAVPVGEVIQMEGRMGGDVSLNAPIRADSGSEMQDFLVADTPTPEILTMQRHDRRVRQQWLFQAMAKLDDRERRIIQRRQLNEEAVTLEDLGQEMGVSKERVRQLESRAMGKLKQEMSRHVC